MATTSWGSAIARFGTVLATYLKHHSKLGCGLASLLTASGELIFSTVVFQCPCSAAWNLPYSLVFLLLPALVFYLLGCVLRTRSLCLLCSCCRTRNAGINRCDLCDECCRVSGPAVVSSVTWVAVALLGGAVYECCASGSTFKADRLCVGRNSSCAAQLPLVPCRQAQDPLVQDLQKVLRAESQVVGWSLIAAVILLFLIFTCVSHHRAGGSSLQLKFWKIYSEEEHQCLRTQVTERATKLADENVRCFFEGSRPTGCNIPSMERWQEISSPYPFNPEDKYLSALHRSVNEIQNRHTMKSPSGDEMPCGNVSSASGDAMPLGNVSSPSGGEVVRTLCSDSSNVEGTDEL
ncbi:calcium homeostasis modulator protein 6 isoform X1 [Equus caballus]|uniref:Calcium homeostasis modulator family member 6 n=1 Tax=Equus caballus TaxID=9796 RepID=A0A9L0TU96_HORSE|nr:calcium homeostasis modulator protein 6 [Equus caballus]XP_008516372.1 PREDICTED: protein FAM26F-like isoform X1 [Equus przewalskii]